MKEDAEEFEEEDGWSLSLPPSTDNLVENRSGIKQLPNNDHIVEDNIIEEPSTENKNTNGVAESHGVEFTENNLSMTNNNLDEDNDRPRSHLPSMALVARDQMLIMTNGSHQSSVSSTSLKSPSISKSVPANPHTTREDAPSILTKDLIGSFFEDSLVQSNSPRRIGTNNASLQSNQSFRTLLESPESPSIYSNLENEGNRKMSDGSSASPKIISYRKSKRSISGATVSSELPRSPKFDPKLYSEDFFQKSKFRYAAMKRNIDFHQLFKSIDLTDRLLDDFSCSLSREILLQGRIYISENHICFNSNLLGWVTHLVIEVSDIISIEKKLTAGIFPNGIVITTDDAKHTFASFLSRDQTLSLMNTVWETNGGRRSSTQNSNNDQGSSIEPTNSKDSKSSEQLDSYILSIDGDDVSDDADESPNENFDVDNELPNNETLFQTFLTKIVKFKDDSGYTNIGPEVHGPTELDESYVLEENEIELCDETIEASLGVVFEILFGTNTKFVTKYLTSQNASEITDFSKFHPMDSDPTKLERSYSYKKALNFSIGPKSTNCEVSEIIEHLNFADYITLVSHTRTPDVPLGNSFSIMNRYRLTWGAGSTTRLRMSYKIQWTGRSWIKGVIEKLTLAGQKDASLDLMKLLKEEIKDSTFSVEGPSLVTEVVEESTSANDSSVNVNSNAKELESTLSTVSSSISFSPNFAVFLFLALVLLIQIKTFFVLRRTDEVLESLVKTNVELLNKLDSIGH